MEFDDHEEQEEEIGIPVSGSYENSSRVPKMTSTGDLGGGVSTRKTTCRYRECLKNHAVGIGGHAVDGCGEFMAAGEEGTLDALKCAACNCHRNFHRKEIEGEGFHHNFSTSPFSYRTPGGGGGGGVGGGYIHVAPHNHHHHHHQHHRPLALPSASGGGGGGGNSRDDQDEDVSNPTSSGSRKRFRTKFTQEQKDKMLAFAERLGWRIQKHDEAAVQQFCTETCVKRHVLKVWMHNNKHTLEQEEQKQKQKQQHQQAGECGGDEWGMGN